MKHKQVRLILPDRIVEMEGTPEELAERIQQECDSIGMAKVIPFPARGVYAHPSNGMGGSQ